MTQFGITSGANVGNEILQVQGITSSGLPSGATQQTTVFQCGQAVTFGAVCATALALTTSATLTQVPNLSVNLTAGNTYVVNGYLSFSSSSGGGLAVSLGQGTVQAATCTFDTWVFNGTSTSAQGNTTALSTILPTVGGIATCLEFTGSIKPTVSGTFAIFAAQNVGGNAATTTINVGSYLDILRVA